MSANPRRPGFILQNVHVVEFSQRQWPLELNFSDDSVAIGYGTSFNCHYDEKNNLAAVHSELELVLSDEDNYSSDEPYTLATLETLVVFEIVEEDDVDQTLPFALDFVANIIGIAYSTTRGILIGRIPHERLEQAPPPAISPREVVREMKLNWVSE